MFKYLSVILSAFLFLLSFQTVSAFTYQTGENLTLSADREFDETVLVTAQNLTIDSSISGDLYCAGQDITINGNVAGDIICAGQTIKVNGRVEGNVRLVGQSLFLSGQVGYSATLFGQSITQDANSEISGDLLYGAQNMSLSGLIGRDAFGGAQSLVIDQHAFVGRNLDHFTDSSGKIEVAEGTVIGVYTPHLMTVPEPSNINTAISPFRASIASVIFSIFSTAILVITLLYFFSHQTKIVSQLISTHPVKSLFIGLAVLVTGPIAAILSMITAVGAVLGVVILLFYIISIILSFSYVAIIIGTLLKKNFKQLRNTNYLNALAGCAILVIATHLPYVGGLLTFFTLLIGLGSTFLSYLPGEK